MWEDCRVEMWDVRWPVHFYLFLEWDDVGELFIIRCHVMHTGSTELVKIVSKYLSIFLQIPFPPACRESTWAAHYWSHCGHMQTGPRPGQADSWAPDTREETPHYTPHTTLLHCTTGTTGTQQPRTKPCWSKKEEIVTLHLLAGLSDHPVQVFNMKCRENYAIT